MLSASNKPYMPSVVILNVVVLNVVAPLTLPMSLNATLI